MKKVKNSNGIESFLVMLLMVIFAIATAFIIIQAKLAFERVIENKNEDENARIALAYVNKRVRQNDVLHAIDVIENPENGSSTLKITHEDGLFTYIYLHEGMMYECYTDAGPSLEYSTELVSLSVLEFKKEDELIFMEIEYEYHGEIIKLEQVMALRSKGVADE